MKTKAIEYLNRGWSVIPIQAGKKIPAINTWTEYQTRLPTIKEVEKWWTDMPDSGIAVVCGKISGLIVVDLDAGKGMPDTAGLELPATLSAKTGGNGFHHFYKWREGLVSAKVGIRHLVDIRSDNSIIILPPSLHATGNRYAWLNEGEVIAEAPKWLEAKLQPQHATDWEQFFTEEKSEGVRNMSATQVAGKIMYDMSPEVWDTLGVLAFKSWNTAYNKPPLSDYELKTIWNSIKRAHIKGTGAPIKEEKNENLETGLTEIDEEAEILKNFKKDKVEGTYLLAKYIVKKYDIITVGESDREIYLYGNGFYKLGENEVILPEIQRILGCKVNKSAKLETLHKIQDMTSFPRTVFHSADLRFIPVRNGVFDRIDRKLLPHSPLYRFTFQFPVNYDPQAPCPKTIDFFNTVLNEDQMPTMKEWLGYFFHRNYSYKKALIMVGQGDTGKTTLLETIVHLLGLDNISAVSLQKMSGDKFSAAHLLNRHGNLVDELSARDISDTGNFKVATGGGLINGEYKFGNQFSFYNFSKFTFACNKIPDVSDFDDEAYFNRWIVVRFDKKIKNKIPNFIQTLTTEEERSGLFNYAMEGLDNLLFQGKFTYGKDATETKLEMMRGGSSLAIFSAEKLEQVIGSELSKEDLYRAYTDFCLEEGLSADTIKMVGLRLPYYVSYMSDGVSQKNKETKRVWRNVALKECNTLFQKEEEKKEDVNWGPF